MPDVEPWSLLGESAPGGLGFTLFRDPEGAMEDETRALPSPMLHKEEYEEVQVAERERSHLFPDMVSDF